VRDNVDHYQFLAANLLKAELKKRGVTYAQLVEKLAAGGVRVSELNMRNRMSRGSFSAAFMIQCLTVIGVRTLRIDFD
jgi:hypothetical protein